MPGFELIDKKERSELNKIFTLSNGVMFAHGFENIRTNNYLVRKFEKKICKKLGVKYCLATTSGTMAQYIAMKALGIKKGDQVITQCFTFVATVEAILALGAEPVVLNVDKTLNMDIEELKKNINKKTKLIIPVPMLGNPTRIDKIKKISKKFNIPIIEDACESLGAKYKNKYVGTTCEIGIFSLDFAKTITTGEGGLIVTNSKKLDKFCREFHDHGHENNPSRSRGKDTRSIAGLNLRMTELQAAVGLAQINKLDKIVFHNKKNKKLLKNIISKNNKIEFREITDNGELSDTLIFFLKNKYQANKFEKIYSQKGYPIKNLPNAIDWHFAGTWKHMFKHTKKHSKNWKYAWSKSEKILERSISIPILIKEKRSEIIKKGKLINYILDKYL